MGEISFINLPILLIAKIFVLFALTIYFIFALVIVRQVKLMTDTLQTGFEDLIKFFSYVHLFFSIAVFIFALIIL